MDERPLFHSSQIFMLCYELDNRGTVVRFEAEARVLPSKVRGSNDIYTDFYPMNSGGSFPGDTAAGALR
jgi:hypothetical protein